MTETPPPYGQDPSGQDPAGQPPAGQQPPYGPPQPNAYGAPQPHAYGPPPPYGYAPPRDHPKAMLALILGIVGLVVCGFVAPFAWVIGGRAVAEIDASGGQLGGRGQAQAGRILGIVGTAIIGLGLAFIVVVVIIAVAGAATSTT